MNSIFQSICSIVYQSNVYNMARPNKQCINKSRHLQLDTILEDQKRPLIRWVGPTDYHQTIQENISLL